VSGYICLIQNAEPGQYKFCIRTVVGPPRGKAGGFVLTVEQTILPPVMRPIDGLKHGMF